MASFFATAALCLGVAGAIVVDDRTDAPACAKEGHSCSVVRGGYPDCCPNLVCDLDRGFVCRSTLNAKKSPDQFFLDFHTDVDVGSGVFSFNITRELAPIGVDRLYALVQDGFFNEAAFFRVVPDFVVQFGIAGTPAENAKWNHALEDDPVKQSNTQGSLVYATAGKNTRTTQLFLNYKDNKRLDDMGFAPIGNIVSGFEVAEKIYNPTPGNSNGVDQDKYTQLGNQWIREQYPKINFIKNVTIRS